MLTINSLLVVCVNCGFSTILIKFTRKVLPIYYNILIYKLIGYVLDLALLTRNYRRLLRYITVRLVLVITLEKAWLVYRKREGYLSRYIYKYKVRNALKAYYNAYSYFSEKITYYKAVKRFY